MAVMDSTAIRAMASSSPAAISSQLALRLITVAIRYDPIARPSRKVQRMRLKAYVVASKKMARMRVQMTW